MRRSHAGGIFRSFASFPGPVQRRAPISSATNHSGTLKLVHSGPLKGYTNGSKGGSNAFTMIPVNVVGNEKPPPDYVPDEPTSPEVTCMGRVRRNKQCKAWDAPLSTEKQLRNQKSKRLESPRRISDLQLSIPKSLSVGPSPSMASTWKKMLGLIKDINGLQGSHLQRKLRQEDLVIDLSRFCSESETAARDRIPSRPEVNHGDGFFYINSVSQSGEGDEESNVVEDGIHIQSEVPPPNCLVLMRNSSRSKVFHSHDDDDNDQGVESNQLQGNPIAFKPSQAGDQISGKRSNPPLALKPSPADGIARKRNEAFQFLKNKKQSFPSAKHLLTR